MNKRLLSLLILVLAVMMSVNLWAQDKKTWDFTKGLSDETIADLQADANWTVTLNDDGSFKQANEATKLSGEFKANGNIIKELGGLSIGTTGLSKNNNVILMSSRFRINRDKMQLNFPKLKGGQTITIVGRSANSTTENRGIKASFDYMVRTEGPEDNLIKASLGEVTNVWKVDGDAEQEYDIQFTMITGGVDFTLFMIDDGDSINDILPSVQEPYAVLTTDTTSVLSSDSMGVTYGKTLTFYYDDKKTERNGMSVGRFRNASDVPWYDQRVEITNVLFNDSFANCNSLTSTAWWFSGCVKLTSITGISNLNTVNVTNMRLMFYGCSSLTSLDVSGFNTTNVTDMNSMFSYCSGLTGLDVSNFNTANVTDMQSMFSGCSGLTSLDVSHFNTGNVTGMGMWSMFDGCSSLTTLDVSHFNTDNVTSMMNMFYNCSGLTTLDVSHFNTDNVTGMGSMFDGCSSLTTLDVSHFNTGNVTGMINMFGNCSGLTSLDVSHFNTDNVTNMRQMFYGCSGLTTLDVSHFKTDNVTDMGAMFYGCSGLTSLDLSNLNTDNVTVMKWMFTGCSGLTTIDLSKFNTSNVTEMSRMFEGCSDLTTIYAGNGWSTEAVTDGRDMFTGCTKLIGGAGTTYDENHTDYTYAHIDRGTPNPGYFTQKDATVWSVIGTLTGGWDTDVDMTSTDGINFKTSFPYMTSGSYEFKIRADHDWTVNYGEGGLQGGPNVVVTVSEDLSTVVTTFNADTKEIAYSVVAPVYSVVGGFNGWDDSVTGVMTKDENGIYSVTLNLESGDYDYKVRANHEWTYNWGADGVQAGSNNLLTVNEAGPVTIYFDPVTHIVSTSYPQQMEQVATPTFSWNEDLLTISSETEGATITYKFEDGYYLVGGNGDWGNFKNQKMSQSSEEYIYTYVLQGFGTDLWFAFGDVAALNAIDNGNWNQLFGATIDGDELSGSYDRRYNLNGDHSFHVDGLAAYYRFTINTQDKTYLIEPLDSDPGFIASVDNVYTYTNPVEIKHDVYITAIARKEGMKDSEVATLDYPYTAWRDLRDAISIARNVYGQAKDNDLVSEQMQNELYHQIMNAEDSCVVRTAKADVINEMAYSLRILADDILQMLNTGPEPYAVLSENNTILTFYYDEEKDARNGMSVGPFTYSYDSERQRDVIDSGWDEHRDNITTVVFEDSFANCTTLTSTAYWFYGCSNLVEIVNIGNLNTDNVTDMGYMFWGCSSLTSINVSNFNTAKVTNMDGMFSYCSGLTSLDVSGFNTANVTSMGDMFWDCSSLESINVSGFNTSNVWDFGGMFGLCSSLKTLDVSHLDTSSSTWMRRMFSGCTNLTNLDVSGFTTGNVINMVGMFEDCPYLTSLDVSGFKTDSVTDMSYMFCNDSTLTSLDVSGFKTDNVTNMVGMFWGCSSLTIVNVSNFNTAKVTNMSSMFDNCSKLTSLDVSGFKTDNVTDMSLMFCNDSTLTSLDVSGFKTDSAADMSCMFYGCSGLTTLDVTGFNTQNVSTMWGMFSDCSSLTSLDVSHFNTRNVTSMTRMFNNCKLLSNLDVSNFNTDNTIGLGAMFRNCANLTNLEVSSFNTSNTQYLWSMFEGCTNLTNLDVSNFKTDNVIEMVTMFAGCSSITNLDLSNFKTDSVSNMRKMFYNCSQLKTIYVDNDWNTSKVIEGDSIFYNCNALVGGLGTIYDENHTDYTYARIDGGTSASGYFTRSGDAPYVVPDATFDSNGVLAVGGSTTMTDALESVGGRDEVAKTITAIVWNSSAALTNSDLTGISNPNMLIYVPSESQAPHNRDNVVIGNDSTGYTAKNIVLSDVVEGNGNFYCPKEFTAEMISYTHEYQQSTEVGVSRGWETIAMPFNVQTVMHEKQGLIAPFGNSTSKKHFWLRHISTAGQTYSLAQATTIEANMPYLISMPNSDAYPDEYNLAGRVTFSSQNVPVMVTDIFPVHMSSGNGGMLMFVPCFQTQQVHEMVYALNVGEARDGYPEGSVFEANYREIRPFEAFTVHEGNSPAPQFIPVSDFVNSNLTGIEELRFEDVNDDQWYDLNGRKLQKKPTQKGVYLLNGRKVVMR